MILKGMLVKNKKTPTKVGARPLTKSKSAVDFFVKSLSKL